MICLTQMWDGYSESAANQIEIHRPGSILDLGWEGTSQYVEGEARLFQSFPKYSTIFILFFVKVTTIITWSNGDINEIFWRVFLQTTKSLSSYFLALGYLELLYKCKDLTLSWWKWNILFFVGILWKAKSNYIFPIWQIATEWTN